MIRLIFTSFLIVLLAACGGGGGDDAGAGAGAGAPISNDVSGGTPSSPIDLSFNFNNLIDINPFNNYFTYTAQAGEKIIIRSTLNVPLTDQQKSRCGSTGGTSSDGFGAGRDSTGIIVYDLNLNLVGGICGESMVYTFVMDGTYIFYFDYSSGSNFGHFNASSTLSNESSGPGSPGAPSIVNLGSSNEIKTNAFYNYYTYDALAGEKLVFNVTLNTPLSDPENTRCASRGGDPQTGSGTSALLENGVAYNEIIVYDQNFSVIGGECGTSHTYTFGLDGTYILHFSFSNNPGVFNAASI